MRTFLGRAGTGDLVATALAPKSRNRSAGELLSQGVPAAEIPERLGQAVEALETVPLLARAIESAGIRAPGDVGARAARRRASCRSRSGSGSSAPSSPSRLGSAAGCAAGGGGFVAWFRRR